MVSPKKFITLNLTTDGCVKNINNFVQYVEHVEAIISLTCQKRSDIEIFLISPQG